LPLEETLETGDDALKWTAVADDARPMLARLAVLAVSIVAAAATSASPLTGVWSSTRDLRLLELEETEALTIEQGELRPSLDLSGPLAATYGDREIELRLAERSARFSYRIVATGSDFLDVQHDGTRPDETGRGRLLPQDGLIHVSVEDLAF